MIESWQSGLYDRALRGIPPMGTPDEWRERLSRDARSDDELADRLVLGCLTVTGGSGFALGIPGWTLLPVTLPADVASTLLLQLHMCQAIALIGREDPGLEGTRTRVLQCLESPLAPGEEGAEPPALEGRLVEKLGDRGIRFVFEAIAAGGRRGVALRRLPLVGGVIGAGANAWSTLRVGEEARRAFLGDGPR